MFTWLHAHTADPHSFVPLLFLSLFPSLSLQICATPVKKPHFPVPVLGWSDRGHPHRWHVHIRSKISGVAVQSQCIRGCYMVW